VAMGGVWRPHTRAPGGAAPRHQQAEVGPLWCAAQEGTPRWETKVTSIHTVKKNPLRSNGKQYIYIYNIYIVSCRKSVIVKAWKLAELKRVYIFLHLILSFQRHSG